VGVVAPLPMAGPHSLHVCAWGVYRRLTMVQPCGPTLPCFGSRIFTGPTCPSKERGSPTTWVTTTFGNSLPVFADKISAASTVPFVPRAVPSLQIPQVSRQVRCNPAFRNPDRQTPKLDPGASPTPVWISEGIGLWPFAGPARYRRSPDPAAPAASGRMISRRSNVCVTARAVTNLDHDKYPRYQGPFVFECPHPSRRSPNTARRRTGRPVYEPILPWVVAAFWANPTWVRRCWHPLPLLSGMRNGPFDPCSLVKPARLGPSARSLFSTRATPLFCLSVKSTQVRALARLPLPIHKGHGTGVF